VITILAGGVGGARFADGVVQAVGADNVSVVVNTADDFDLYGLHICPDLDTVLYTLAGIANPVLGWGIDGDTRATLSGIAAYGEEPWFQLGDRDFATHILRTAWLRNGTPLGSVMYFLRQRLGVQTPIFPMSDDPVATMIDTSIGRLVFQDYFVRRRQQDDVLGVEFTGIETARPYAAALDTLHDAELIIVAPSNPIVSIGPILAIDAYRQALRDSQVPVIAISPLIGGKALKGPADRMLQSLGHESSALGVARLYDGLIDGFVIDHVDAELAAEIEDLGISVLVTDAIMHDVADRGRLAREVSGFAKALPVKVTA
jgi:LPPG:FO 2-phospho-L-lactate transferase